MTAIKTINTVSLAKLRFSDAVSRGIEQLMKEGFSRDHSTSMLLNCLRRKDQCPDDKEVFKVVDSLGVNLNEAITALTVAYALRQVISARGMSPTEAINELTDRIRTDLQRHMRHSTHIMSIPLPAETNTIIESVSSLDTSREVKEFAQTERIRQNTTKQPNNTKSPQSKFHSSKSTKKANTHMSKNNASKAATRRRASKPEEITNPAQESSPPDEASVNIDLVTKSMLNCDDVNINRDSIVLNKVSVSSISRKRGISPITEDEHTQLQSPVKSVKRPRL